jgi:hypothetical protein
LFENQELTLGEYGKQHIPDLKLKTLSKYYRPSFSPHTNSWQIDLIFAPKNSKIYLFVINENTRYLFVYPIDNKKSHSIYEALTEHLKEFSPRDEPIYFSGDGERGFIPLSKIFQKEKFVNFFFRQPQNKSGNYHMTNSYNLINSVVRTIRNMIGRVSQLNPEAVGDTELMTKIIDIYNNTVHSAFSNKYTPQQVQAQPALELAYIRLCKAKLDAVEEQRLKAGLLSYKKDNILLVHVPFEKTTLKFEKRRRNFDKLAKFVRYEGANVVIELLKKIGDLPKELVIPIYYTKYLAKDLNDYKSNFYDLFKTN